jgi:hypothetical protein
VVVRVAANQVANFGSGSGEADPVVGIKVTGVFTQLEVADNLVRCGDGVGDRDGWRALVIGQLRPKGAGKAGGEAKGYSPSELKNLLAEFASQSSTGVRGNSFDCFGAGPFVLVETGDDCLFCDNRIQGPASSGDPQVVIATRTVIFNANYVTGAKKLNLTAVDLEPLIPQLTVLGNLTTGEIILAANPLPAPWHQLNVRA